MTSTRAVVLLVALAVAGVAFVPAASGAVATGVGDADRPTVGNVDASENDSPDENSSNASVSAFMQSNAAQAEHTVESGMFDAAFENAANESRADVVVDRTVVLENRLDALEAERDELRADENLSQPEHQARLTRLTVELASLNQSIERAEHRANESGVDGERLAVLRSNASNLAGPDVAETARGLAGVNAHPGAGPPADGQSAADQPGANDGDSGPSDERPSDRDVPNEERDGSPADDADESDDGDADDESSADSQAATNSSDDAGGGPPDDVSGQ